MARTYPAMAVDGVALKLDAGFAGTEPVAQPRVIYP
jgi:hypothetical protein